MDEERAWTTETVTRVGTYGRPPRPVEAQVWHVMPWVRGFDEERFRQLLRVEAKFPHPMEATEDEMAVMSTNPRLAFNHIVEHPTRGLEHRLRLGRN